MSDNEAEVVAEAIISTERIINTNLPFPQKLDFRGNIATNWKRFKRMWTNYEIATGLEKQEGKTRTATFLTCIGADALEIFDGFVFANEGETNDIDAVIEKFENFCIGKTNETYERYCFNKRDQEQGENIDTYVAALRTLVKTCNYGTIEESLIRDRIVIGLRENSTRKKLLQDAKLTLNRCVDVCRANEKTSIQMKDISQEEVQYVRRRDQKPRKNFTPRPQTDKKFDDCKYCGRQHVQKREACPAWGKTCGKCGKSNHFKIKCESGRTTPSANKPNFRQKNRRTVHNIEQSDDENMSDEEYMFIVEDVNTVGLKRINAIMNVQNKQVKFQLDCGSTVNVLPTKDYKKIFNDKELVQLKPSNQTLVMFNKTETKPAGKRKITIVNPKNKKWYNLEFVVVTGNVQPILGSEAIQRMKLITVNKVNIHNDNISKVDDKTENQRTDSTVSVVSKQMLEKQYPDVFKGEGKLPGKLKLDIDETFEYVVVFKPGIEMYMADTLSRAYINKELSGQDIRPETEKEVETVNAIQFLPITAERCKTLQSATAEDEELQILSKVIKKGWPIIKDAVDIKIQKYFPFREELTIQNGLIFKSDRVVVPNSARADLTEKAHSSHIGIQGCLRRARECLYWPNMNSDIESCIKTCETCNAFNMEQQKESLHCHEKCTRPWEKIACDLFELNNKKGKEVIGILKKHFARYGLPDCVFSDNGPPFNSHEFRHFSNQYEFTHTTSSPRFPQSNGKVENAIKTAKRLMVKSHKDAKDPYLALLDWRNTPSEGLDSSPSQRMFGRRGRTLLPSASRLLKPDIQTDVVGNKRIQKEKQRSYYNRSAKDKTELAKGDIVRIKPFKNGKEWTKAKVDEKCNIRSYNVTTEDGSTYRRNRRHLILTKEPMIEQSELDLPTQTSADRTDNHAQPIAIDNQVDDKVIEHQEPKPTIRTSERIRSRPKHLQDYVCTVVR
ncbi:unnamed protein product [Mytilus edulis]|uniref:Integrase catalytic domain-containing protein n=1 Tax=Mytilus edulis TaxID=6550 RepID=A0A8S3SEZ3_MYTED|nr:unnamed protein product [Mytilus edulis]